MAELKVKDLSDEQKRYIHEHFVYNHQTGLLERNNRSKKIGGEDKDGYLVVNVLRRKIKYHRLVWFLCKGYYPTSELDHIDRNRKNNRIENLRESSRIQNQREIFPNKDTGEKHIYIDNTTVGLKAKYVVRRQGLTKRFRNLEEAKAYRDEIWKGE